MVEQKHRRLRNALKSLNAYPSHTPIRYTKGQYEYSNAYSMEVGYRNESYKCFRYQLLAKHPVKAKEKLPCL